MRVFALSDVHVDYSSNMSWLQQLSVTDYTADTLILAGDVSDDLDKLDAALSCLRAKFARVFFVPGNHELWIRKREFINSVAKFWQLLRRCASLGVQTSPAKVGGAENGNSVWIIPLFSWYVQPEEGDGSLFLPKEGEDQTLEIWSDNYFTHWPPLNDNDTIADYFLRLNEHHVNANYDAPVISFSHFLPRADLILPTKEELEADGIEFIDPEPSFNFSRVAGCTGLERQIRQLGSAIHVYGHQHRNRNRQINNIRYISHCLGYHYEGINRQVDRSLTAPKLIWDTER